MPAPSRSQAPPDHHFLYATLMTYFLNARCTVVTLQVRQHARKDDAWIAVDGKVYDITEHLVNHHGWHDNAAISTVLSILAHAGTDCSEEFREIHRPYPVAWRQLKAYYIGDLATGEEDAVGWQGAAPARGGAGTVTA